MDKSTTSTTTTTTTLTSLEEEENGNKKKLTAISSSIKAHLTAQSNKLKSFLLNLNLIKNQPNLLLSASHSLLFNNNGSIHLGFISFYFVLILVLVLLILNYFGLLIVCVYNLMRLFMTMFCIFSFYTWLNLIYGNRYNLNDKNVYLLFLTCFISEFFIQFLVYNTNSIAKVNIFYNNNNNTNTNNNNNNNKLSQSKEIELLLLFSSLDDITLMNKYIEYLIENAKNVLIISLICTLTSYYSNYKLFKENVFFILLISLTRFYGSVYFSTILPNSICSYFTYLCAFGGVLFSHYINSIVLINEHLGLCNVSISFFKNSNNSKRQKLNLINIERKYFDNSESENGNFSMENSNNSDASANENFTQKSNKNKRKLAINSSMLSKRRTSLPTNMPLKTEKKYLENSLLNDIQRIVDDLLDNEDYSINNLINSIKTIKNLINHSNLVYKFAYQNKHHNNTTITTSTTTKSINNMNCHNSSNKQSHNGKYFNSNSKSILNNRYYKVFSINSNDSENKSDSYLNEYSFRNINDLNSYSADEDEENKRSLPAQYYRRLSHTAWSTTTSATGLPIDLPPSRQRSLSLKCPIFNHMVSQAKDKPELRNKDLNNKSELLAEIKIASANNNNNTMKGNSNETLCGSGLPIYNENVILTKNSYDDEDEDNTTGSSVNSNISCQNKTSDYESGESPTNSDYNSDTDKLHLKNSNIASHHHLICNKKLEQIKEELFNNGTINANRSSLKNSDKLLWQAEDLKNLELLNYLHDWSFPIFQFYEKSNHNVISQMAYKIFDEVGLFKSFDIPVNSFIQYFTALERGYIDLPYHNKIHAADVLHACYYLTTQAVPGLVQINDNSSKFSKERIPLNPYQYSLKFSLANNETYGCLGANFTPIELLALYCSAAMHDYEHPGRNNQFLVTINSPLALLYNDRSVLENHHASSSWLLLKSNPKFNFLSGLDAVEWKRFRFLILENILATDLSKHFSIIAEFNQKANIDPNRKGVLQKPFISFDFDSGIDWKNESDRLLCAQMVLKLADINAPLKEKELHLQWTNRIVQEFYQQGDEELSLGLNISPFMDRRKPQVAKLQENFISNLVGSLCNAFTHAGLLPGILMEDVDESSETDSENASISTNEESPTFKNKPKIFYSELLSNFKSNYEMWTEKIKQEQLTSS